MVGEEEKEILYESVVIHAKPDSATLQRYECPGDKHLDGMMSIMSFKALLGVAVVLAAAS